MNVTGPSLTLETCMLAEAAPFDGNCRKDAPVQYVTDPIQGAALRRLAM